MDKSFEYDVVLSFAGEDRSYVEQVAASLVKQGVKIFYDEYEQANLWGKDLYEYLDDIYRNKARYCVMFISKSYALKAWPTHERRSAQARAFESSQEYILPAKFDSTEIPGVRPTVGYVNLIGLTPEEFAQLIVKKLGGMTVTSRVPSGSHHTVRLMLLFEPTPKLNANLSEIVDTALKSSLEIVTNDYGRKVSFPYSLKGGFLEKSNERVLYQMDHHTGFTNFKIQDNLALYCDGTLKSIEVYRWEQDKDTLFDLEKLIRHSIYLFNFVCRWQEALTLRLGLIFNSTKVTIVATMPHHTILFDNRGFAETEMDVAYFNADNETVSGTINLTNNICQSPAKLSGQMCRLFNFVLSGFEYSSFGRKNFPRISDDTVARANQSLMSQVTV